MIQRKRVMKHVGKTSITLMCGLALLGSIEVTATQTITNQEREDMVTLYQELGSPLSVMNFSEDDTDKLSGEVAGEVDEINNEETSETPNDEISVEDNDETSQESIEEGNEELAENRVESRYLPGVNNEGRKRNVGGLYISGQNKYDYTGEQIRPDMRIFDNGVELIEGVDVIRTYRENISGRGGVTFTGTENWDNEIVYYGQVTMMFEIVFPKIDMEQTPIATAVKRGSSISESQISEGLFRHENGEIVQGEFEWDFDKIDDPIVRGNKEYPAKFIVSPHQSIPFNVLVEALPDEKTLKNIDELTYDDIPLQIYTGQQLTPRVKIKDEDRELVEGRDFNITYGLNIHGQGSVTIEGTDNWDNDFVYYGSKTLPFEIKILEVFMETPPTAEVVAIGASVKDTYIFPGVFRNENGEVVEGSYQWDLDKIDDQIVTEDKEYPAKFIVSKHQEIPFNVLVKVDPNKKLMKPIYNMQKTPIYNKYDYTGEPIKPSLTIHDGDKELVEGVDYNVTYGQNMYYHGFVKIEGTSNYDNEVVYTGSTTRVFEIPQPKLEVLDEPTATPVKKGSPLSQVNILPGRVVDEYDNEIEEEYIWSWSHDEVEEPIVNESGYFKAYLWSKGISDEPSLLPPNINDPWRKGAVLESFDVYVEVLPEETEKEIKNLTYDEIPTQKYTSQQVTPEVKLYDDNKELIEGVDYTLDYGKNIFTKGTVTIRGTENYDNKVAYIGELEIDFTIESPMLRIKEYARATPVEKGSPLSQSNIIPGIYEDYFSNVLEGTYRWLWEVVGDEEPIVTETNEYLVCFFYEPNAYSVLSVTVEVLPEEPVIKDINELSVYSISVQDYTGKQVKPSVELFDDDKMGEKQLVEGEDYTLTYGENIYNVGKVYITGTNNPNSKFRYTGVKEEEFSITSPEINIKVEPRVEPVDEGTSLKDVTIIPGLIEDEFGKEISVDYVWDLFNNTYPVLTQSSYHSLFIKKNGVSMDRIEIFIEVIEEEQVTKDLTELTYDPIPIQEYTGSVPAPYITLYDGEKVLIKGVDYTISWLTSYFGLGRIIVRGTDNSNNKVRYTGTLEVDYEITQPNLTLKEPPSFSAVEKGSSLSESDIVSRSGLVVDQFENEVNGYWVWAPHGEEIPTVTESGYYKIYLVTNPYFSNKEIVIGSFNVYVEVLPYVTKYVSNLSLGEEIPQQKYTGSQVTPPVTLYDGDKKLVDGVDISITYSENIFQSGWVNVTGLENTENEVSYTGTASFFFSIDSPELVFKKAPTVAIVEKGTQLGDIPIIPGEVEDEYGTVLDVTYKWESPEDVVTRNDYPTCYIIESRTEKCIGVYYIPVEVIREIKDVNDLELITIPDQDYTGQRILPEINIYDGDVKLIVNEDYGLTYGENRYGQGHITISGLGNLDKKIEYTGQVEITFSIGMPTLSIKEAPIATPIEKGSSLSNSTLIGGSAKDEFENEMNGYFEWGWRMDGTKAPIVTESGEFEVVFWNFKGLEERFNIFVEVISDGTENPGDGDGSENPGGSEEPGNPTDPEVPSINDGWVKEGNIWYYYKDNQKVTGWLKLGNIWYYLNADGSMKTGWLMENNTWYYLNPDGSMKTGWLKLKDTWYYLNKNGAMAVDWAKIGNTWYNFHYHGGMATGWRRLGNTWYYLQPSGAMKTGWLLEGNIWYYLNSNGAMKTGWLKENNTWYYLNKNGSMKTGWLKENNQWYYLYANGKMAANTQIGNYHIGANGVMIEN